MIPAIVFREGHSGHFLQSVILDRPAELAKFRMADNFQNTKEIFLTHNTNLELDKFDPVYRILPTNNIYNAIYNIFMKKTLVEEFPEFDLASWLQDPIFWYDKCYYHIKEYYFLIKQDIVTNTFTNIVDFDKITDCDYLKQWLYCNFGKTITQNQISLIKNYASTQLEIALEDDSATTMQEIVSPLTDSMLEQNPWFWAYSVFKFEQNNKFAESDRLWSVNDIRAPHLTNDLLKYQYIKCNK